jgi:hypothetical protein
MPRKRSLLPRWSLLRGHVVHAIIRTFASRPIALGADTTSLPGSVTPASGSMKDKGLGIVHDESVQAIQSQVELSKGSVERGMLDDHGPLMDGEEFARRAVEAGINATSFYLYRTNSPLITSLGRGLYCKVGMQIPAGAVEDLLSRRNPVIRLSDHGWTSGERLWFGPEMRSSIDNRKFPHAFTCGRPYSGGLCYFPMALHAGQSAARDVSLVRSDKH